jgi:hypothetical protein
MIKFIIFQKDTHLPNTISSFGDPTNNLYKDGEILDNGDTVKIVDTVDTNSYIFDRYHLRNNEVGLHEPRADGYQIWDPITFSWKDIESKVKQLIAVNKEKINSLTNMHILLRYPYYYQLNAPYDFGQDSAEVITMRTWIDGIRAKANLAKAQLETLSLESEMDLVVKNFEKELGDIA